jgi:hypothetical protein
VLAPALLVLLAFIAGGHGNPQWGSHEPLTVTCRTGSAAIAGEAIFPATIHLSRQVCAGLELFYRSHVVDEETASDVDTAAHEASHIYLGPKFGESLVECRALALDSWVASQLGASRAVAETVYRLARKSARRNLPAAYQSACTRGRAVSIRVPGDFTQRPRNGGWDRRYPRPDRAPR